MVEESTVEFPTRASLTELFESYIRELKATGKGAEAERRWRPVITDLKNFLKHEDARRITREDLNRWKDARLETLAPKTLRDVYLAAIKAVLNSGCERGQLSHNPAAKVKVKVGRRFVTRERGFTIDEAVAVLNAAKNYAPTARELAKMTAAKRWAPWLFAYSGARVAEITQLRKEDVGQRDGITFVRITPEAGSVKTWEYRDVPLHPHLIELGFLEFVAAAEDEPLFYNPKDRKGRTHPSKMTASRIGDWICSLAIIDDDVAPSHAWRHRLKTVGRELGIDGRVLDSIQGHAPRTAGDDYGDVTLRTKQGAIERMPRY